MPTLPGYIAYIDESGDDGLRRVRPDDSNGASEWMVLSCVLINSKNESNVVNWVRSIIRDIDQHQIKHLHYRELRQDKRRIACNAIAALPVRLFVVISNKQNVKRYVNSRAAASKVNQTAWFYCWLSRLLLERVTAYCARKSISHHRGIKPIRFEFSSRGGVRIADISNYFKYLKDQDEIGLLCNDHDVPNWQVIDFEQFYSFPGKDRSGLQLADCVASAFYQGLEMTDSGKVDPRSAIALAGRMCMSKRGKIFNFGVKIMPPYARLLVRPAQQQLLDFYMDL